MQHLLNFALVWVFSFMAFDAKVDAFNTGTGALSTTIVVTGVGFQPKGIIFWWIGRTDSVDAVGRRNEITGMGVAVSTTQRWACTRYSRDAAASSVTSRGQHGEACIAVVETDVFTGLLDLQSLDSDGFTLVVDDVMPFDMRVHYMALGGADLTDLKADTFNVPGTTGNKSFTGVGFQPDFLLFTGCGFVNPPPDDFKTGKVAIGAAVSSTQRGSLNNNSRDNQATMDTDSYCISTRIFAIFPDAGGNPNDENDFVSMDSDGFTIDHVVANGATFQYFYLALKGGKYRVGNLLTKTDATDIVESGFGFSPKAALFVSHCNVESTVATAQADAEMSMGAFSSTTSRGAQAMLDEDAVATSEVETAVEHDAVYANVSAAAAIEGLMDIKSVESDGFTCVMDDADPAASFVWYAAFGDAAAAAVQPHYEFRVPAVA